MDVCFVSSCSWGKKTQNVNFPIYNPGQTDLNVVSSFNLTILSEIKPPLMECLFEITSAIPASSNLMTVKVTNGVKGEFFFIIMDTKKFWT